MRSLLMTALIVISGSVTGLSLGDEPADDVLKQKGLKKSGTTYTLEGEAEFQKKLNAARGGFRQMTAASARQQAYDQELRDGKQFVRELTMQRIELNQQLTQASNPTQHNQLVAMVNGVTDRLNLLNQQQADPEAKRRIDGQAASLREAYVEQVLGLRQVADTVTSRYAELAADPALKTAIERVNQSTRTKVGLGPSKSFLANLALLTKVEGTVLSESVDLRKEGGIYWLDVTFNGKVTRPMAFDTGAADVVLPAEFAAQIGLRPGKDDPIVRCRVADGSIIEARQMTIPSIRVGKFTVTDVSCTIMPADKKDVPPLLGQTFQRHFLLKFSPDSGKLVLSRVEPTEADPKTPSRSKNAPKTSGKPQTRPGNDGSDNPF